MVTSPPHHYATHADLIAAMHALTDDPLAATGSRICIWRGNPEADLMVIGEGPGKNEDEQGKPYVGRAGQLLDRILEAAGFDSQNGVYVTNTVFRRPPDNRDPLPAELAYYKPYLLEAVRLVNPSVILLTGRFSMRQILGEETPTISRVRGQWFRQDGRWIMPVFHPAYLLRNPSREKGSPKSLTWQDIRAVRAKYDEVGGRQDLLQGDAPA